MSTEDIKKYFEGFGAPKEITWINDSSCRVKFENADFARKAYQAFALTTNTEQNTRLVIGEAMVDLG